MKKQNDRQSLMKDSEIALELQNPMIALLLSRLLEVVDSIREKVEILENDNRKKR